LETPVFHWLKRGTRRPEAPKVQEPVTAAPAAPLAIGRAISVPERDPFDAQPPHPSDIIPAVVDAYLVYTDRDRQQSRRTITTRGILDDPEAGWVVSAYCHVRKAGRTFRASRIDEFVDLASGEVIPDVIGYLKEVYARSPQGVVDAAVKKLADEIDVLVFFARADGRLTAREVDAIAGYVSKRAEATFEQEILRKAIRFSQIEQRAYMAALKRLKQRLTEDQRGAILSLMNELLGSKKPIPPFTEAALKSAASIL